ncbi:MAG: hypothetical protein Q9M33_06845 [Robiginitomaculum sp.]|nr:hypothetical protein [Robiginitomaculum sp.]MDQ7077068.1 hypothetical protein [Robiginitomaculum sp.]
MITKKRDARFPQVVCALVLLALPSSALAGKLSSEKIKPDMKYKVTVCQRPDMPKVKGNSQQNYDNAVKAYEAYSVAQQDFADCVEREAGGDLRTLQEVIFAGGQEEIARSQRDIDAFKAELDAFRAKLEGKADNK